MADHVRMGFYAITQGTFDELVEHARAGLAPLLRDTPGFVSYSLTDVGEGGFVSTSAWETREQADAAAVMSAAWVGENLAASVALRENLVGELTTLERRIEHQRVTELVAEIARRGAGAARRLQQPAKTKTGPRVAARPPAGRLPDEDSHSEAHGHENAAEQHEQDARDDAEHAHGHEPLTAE